MYNNLIQNLEQNDITVYSSGDIKEDIILKAEELLNLKFPQDYKHFLKEFGNISFGSFEINGISKTIELQESFSGNAVGISLEAYKEFNLLPKVVLLGDAGLGDQYALNCDEESNSYGKVFYWNPETNNLKVVEYINESFFAFFENRVNKEVEKNA